MRSDSVVRENGFSNGFGGFIRNEGKNGSILDKSCLVSLGEFRIQCITVKKQVVRGH